MTTLAKVAADLYASLQMMPCRCLQHWQAGRVVVIFNCSRCRALQAYEKLSTPSSDASPPSDAPTNQQATADL